MTVLVEDLNAVHPSPQNTTALLFITLLDVNDNPPEFQPSNVYYARISEASKPGIEVKQVFAVDHDKNNGPLVYSMVYGNQWTDAFEITEKNKFAGKNVSIIFARENVSIIFIFILLDQSYNYIIA